MSDTTSNEKNTILKDEQSLLLDHSYDGIQELDHVLPRWWIWLFYVTVIFSAWYMGYYMSGKGPSPQEELAIAMKEIEVLKAKNSAPSSEANEQVLNAVFSDPAKVKQGSEVFTAKCAACHGDKGQGVVGPNLTDNNWIHGKGSLSDIADTVGKGVPEKGMPPWGAVLTPDELQNVTAFVKSLKGTNPPGGKGPEGQAYEN